MIVGGRWTPRAYYNEHDPFVAAWLRELIARGYLMSGDVDERSIEDVEPTDLIGFTRCHFFAGIGGWDYALQLAGWPEAEPIWTGSCPCQPFSTAGKGGGVDDERHLWPAFHWLIAQCRPRYVVGEQVASKAGLGWWDLVATDMEGTGYACAAVDLPACSVGAPHKRSRLFFVADASGERCDGQPVRVRIGGQEQAGTETARCSSDGELADVPSLGRQRWRTGHASHECRSVEQPERLCDAGQLAYACGQGSPEQPRRRIESSGFAQAGTSGVWANCDWIYCRDHKWRAVEPGIEPLAHGVRKRVGMLRGYGNACVPQVAAEVIAAAADIWGVTR